MFVHHITYRHRNGKHEEFAGHGLTPSAALQNAVDTARLAVTALGHAPFVLGRIDSGAAADPSAARRVRNAAVAGRTYPRALS